MARKTVIYGAGKNANVAYEKCIKEGEDVIAFCDSDILKHGKEIKNLPIISKEKLKSLGDDIYVYISPASPIKEEIEGQIIQEGIVDRERIINRSMNEVYISCPSLENVAIITNEGIYSCCSLDNIRNSAPYVNWKSSLEETVDAFIQQRDTIIRELQDKKTRNACTDCPALSKARWSTERRIRVLALSLSYPCQLKCSYCELLSNGKNAVYNPKEIEKAKSIDIEKLMALLEKRGGFDPSEPIQLSGGEITLAPNKKKFLSTVSKYPLQVFTNAIIYDEDVSRAVKKDCSSYLNVSIDAGTADTYIKVKGVDAFEQVVSTLAHYSNDGIQILLKYILLSDNCTQEDYDGFIEIAKSNNTKEVYISCDITSKTDMLPQEVIDGAVFLAKRCIDENIPYTILPYFGERNLKYITEQLDIR
ncbi:radical SAM protein [Pseudobutyrivibrio ruminis]|uniref:radical SAM protein n=1 Tax=Pseudobutyrivibrio ruminis TaxID=46206 RepID=UPI00051C1EED|nr:radical SAM protein [Pseudobutyrivibrio ruminis]